jgi:zinc transporter ZupT
VIALLTPVGAVISYFFLVSIAQHYLGMLLALTAGSFIYLAAADLLPEMHHEHHRANPIFFFTGILVVALFGRLIH